MGRKGRWDSDTNYSFSAGVASDGRLALTHAEWAWRNRRVRRLKREFDHAQVRAYYTRLAAQTDFINQMLESNWPGHGLRWEVTNESPIVLSVTRPIRSMLDGMQPIRHRT